MSEQEKIEFLLKFISIGVKVLSVRIALFLGIILTFGLFSWAMYMPTNERIAAATIFAILVFIPLIRLDSSEKEGKKVVKGESA